VKEKTRQEHTKTSIYKRNTDVNYSLKLKSSRNLVVEIKKKYASFPFNLRSMEDTRSRLGITELVNHNLVSSYPVLWERNGEIIAQFKFTVLILPTTTKRLNEGFDLPWVTSDFKYESDPVLEQIMAMGIAKKKSKEKEEKTKPKQKPKPKSTKSKSTKSKSTKPKYWRKYWRKYWWKYRRKYWWKYWRKN